MHIIRERFHVRKFFVGENVTLCVTASFPGVVDVDIAIACFFHSVAGHRIGNAANRGIIDAAGKFVPTVPTHRRRSGETIVANFMKRRRSDPRRQRALAGGSTMSHHLGKRGIGAATRRDMQLISHQLAFILHAAIGLAVFHRSNNSKPFSAAGAFGDEIVKLRDADGSRDSRTFLFQVEISQPFRAVSIRHPHHPVAG